MFASPGILSRLKNSGLFTTADLYQGRFTATLYPAENEELIIALTALVSLAVREGHVCLHLEHPQTKARLASLDLDPDPLKKLQALAAPKQEGPLILSGGQLYFARFYKNELTLAQKIHSLLEAEPDPFPLSAQALGPAVDEHGQPQWQNVAVFAALQGRFCVISGGPGTGKTHTVARILDLATQIDPQMNIALAAPTGKAASRMSQALHSAFQGALPPRLKEALQEQAQTVHRLLGWVTGGKSRYNQQNPLPLDLLIVDEVSMLDLELATRLLTALPVSCRVIFLGDRHQLASVEAGGVLANICQSVEVNRFSKTFVLQWQTLTSTSLPQAQNPRPLTDHVLELQRSWRFDAQSGIAQLAIMIREGLVAKATDFLELKHKDVHYLPDLGQLQPVLTSLVQEFFKPLQYMTDPIQALTLLDQLRFLSPVRHGPQGTVALNTLIKNIVVAEIQNSTSSWYPGRPVMILENDYSLELFNGDVGLALGPPKALRVFFMGADGLRSFIPERLPRHETCYAMTVHKSQGSEFTHTVLVIPEEPCPVLSRELLYTALTRAKEHFTLCAPLDQVCQAISTPVQRDSGLKAWLIKPILMNSKKDKT